MLQPHEFKALVNSVKDEITSLRQAIQKLNSDQNDAARNATETAKEKWSEIPRIIASSGLGAGKDREAAESNNKNNYIQQGRLIKWTRLAFIAAAIYALIAVFQWNTMDKTYVQIKKQTEAVKASAKAACQNAEIARNTLIAFQNQESDARQATIAGIYEARAQIESESPRMEFFITGSPVDLTTNPIGVPFDLQNTGKTVAKNFTDSMFAVIVPRGKDPDFVYPSWSVTHGVTPNFWENESFAKAHNVVAPEIPVYKIVDGKYVGADPAVDGPLTEENIAVYGKMSYSDIFGGTHRTTFCRWIHALSPGIQKNINKKCAEYNQTETSSPIQTSIPAAPETSRFACNKLRSIEITPERAVIFSTLVRQVYCCPQLIRLASQPWNAACRGRTKAQSRRTT